MCGSSWQAALTQTLAQRAKADRPPRVALLGVGNEFNGDDAAGLVVVRALLAQADLPDRLLVIDAGIAPENHTGPLRAFAPDLVLLIDAAQMDADAGTVCWIDWRATTGISAATHTLPPYMLARFLTAELGCAMALLGIQPAQNSIDSPLSPVVQAAAAALAADLYRLLTAL